MNTNRDNDKVIDHTRLQLSALFDGELGLDEARFLQRRLAHDGELLAGWSRWQLAGDVLRGQAVAAAPAGFADRVAAAVAADSAPVAAPASRRRGRLLPGAALAASVAAMAMFMARQAPETTMPTAPAVEIASAADTVPARLPVPAAPTPPATPAAPDTTLQVAGTAIAVAEVPRRAAERRSRAQQQRASARVQRNASEPRMVAAASAPSAPAPAVASLEAAASPFLPEAAAEVVTARPWPRALLPGNGGAFTVGYGRLPAGAAEPHPFQPRPVDLSRPVNEDTD